MNTGVPSRGNKQRVVTEPLIAIYSLEFPRLSECLCNCLPPNYCLIYWHPATVVKAKYHFRLVVRTTVRTKAVNFPQLSQLSLNTPTIVWGKYQDPLWQLNIGERPIYITRNVLDLEKAEDKKIVAVPPIPTTTLTGHRAYIFYQLFKWRPLSGQVANL